MTRLRLLPPVTTAYSFEEAVPIRDMLLRRGGRLAIDTETTGLDVMRDRVLFWSMATESARFVFPVDVLPVFYPLFERRDISWYLANAKYDMHLLKNAGVDLLGAVRDIIVMDAMDDDTRDHGLKEQSWFRYEAAWGDFKQLFLDPDFVARNLGLDKHAFRDFKKMSVGEKLLFVHDENPELVEDYASCDAFFTYILGEDLTERLVNTDLPTELFPGFSTLLDYFETIEMPLTKDVWEMERIGFPVDRDYVKSIDEPMRIGLNDAKERIYKFAGRKFNPQSPDELREVLFGKGTHDFGLKPIWYTDGGKKEPKPKTDEKTLNFLLARVPNGSHAQHFIEALLKFKHLNKLHGTYVKNLEKILGPDGRVHCRLNQTGARTVRMSSAGPNMQNIPIRNDPYKIRGCFVAPEGRLLVDLDYPQIEFRIAAVLAGEEKMMDSIRKGWDIHSANATNMYPDADYAGIIEARRKKDANEKLNDYDKKMLRYRDGAKTVGLGTMYGEGAKKMAGQLGISTDEAYELIDTFFATYPNIDGMIADFHDYGHAHEVTHTMLGYIRHLHSINSAQRGLVAYEERAAFNTAVQGSGAEMMKLAILRVSEDPDFRALGGQLCLTVHDELICTAPEDTAHDVMQIMTGLMADPFRRGPIQLEYPVPITPDGSVAFRWSEAK